MSVEALALALHHSGAKGTAKLVLLGIANHDGDGGAWPSVKTLAKYAACDERQVQRAIGQLEAAGEIRRIIGSGGNEHTRKDRRPNLYQILLKCPATCDGSKEHRERGDADVTSHPDGVTFSRHGVTSEASRGDIGGSHGVVEMSPEPSLEPSLEPSKKKGAKSARAKRPIDAEWAPAQPVIDEMRKRYPKVAVDRELDEFKDYYLARGTAYADWDATFRNWIRRADKWRREREGVSEDGFR